MTTLQVASTIALLLGVPGCTALFPLDEYDQGSGGGAACGPFQDPAANSFSDDFEGGNAAAWAATSNCAAEMAGSLVTAPVDVGIGCLYTTVASYHLSCDAIHVRVRETTAPVFGVQTVVYVDGANGVTGVVQLILEQSTFSLLSLGDNLPLTDASYDPSSDRWWRLRADRDGVTFETSTNGSDWHSRGGGKSAASLDAVKVSLGSLMYKAIATPGKATFDCYDVAPDSCPP